MHAMLSNDYKRKLCCMAAGAPAAFQSENTRVRPPIKDVFHVRSSSTARHTKCRLIPGKLGVDLHLHRVHIPLVADYFVPNRNVHSHITRGNDLHVTVVNKNYGKKSQT